MRGLLSQFLEAGNILSGVFWSGEVERMVVLGWTDGHRCQGLWLTKGCRHECGFLPSRNYCHPRLVLRCLLFSEQSAGADIAVWRPWVKKKKPGKVTDAGLH